VAEQTGRVTGGFASHTFWPGVTQAPLLSGMAGRSKTIPDIAAVQRAFQMANGLPTHDRARLRVGVLAADGLMISTGMLRGFEQVGFLRDQLRLLGFAEYVPPRPMDAMGCDILLKHMPEASGDASDLLRSAGALWPPVRTRGNLPPH
jgi:hypothetical protein